MAIDRFDRSSALRLNKKLEKKSEMNLVVSLGRMLVGWYVVSSIKLRKEAERRGTRFTGKVSLSSRYRRGELNV